MKKHRKIPEKIKRQWQEEDQFYYDWTVDHNFNIDIIWEILGLHKAGAIWFRAHHAFRRFDPIDQGNYPGFCNFMNWMIGSAKDEPYFTTILKRYYRCKKENGELHPFDYQDLDGPTMLRYIEASGYRSVLYFVEGKDAERIRRKSNN